MFLYWFGCCSGGSVSCPSFFFFLCPSPLRLRLRGVSVRPPSSSSLLRSPQCVRGALCRSIVSASCCLSSHRRDSVFCRNARSDHSPVVRSHPGGFAPPAAGLLC